MRENEASFSKWLKVNQDRVFIARFNIKLLNQELFEQWQVDKNINESQDEEGHRDQVSDDENLQQTTDVDEDQEIYSVPHRYFPPVAGKLKCFKEVHARVAGNMKTFSQLNHP